MIVSEANKEQVRPLLAKLKRDFKMTQREIAIWCGVNQCVVNLWATGKGSIQSVNLNRLKEAIVLLGGRQVRYKGQAIDILLGVE